MTLKAAVITAIYDSYDNLKPALPQTEVPGRREDGKGIGSQAVEWVCITDDPQMEDEDTHLGWRIVYEPRPGVHPNRAAKTPKYRPWDYTDAPASVWIDASFRVLSEAFAAEALAYADPIAQFAHPWRDCLLDEARASAPLPKYAGEPVLEQADRYIAAGHPLQWGLWATGVIARRHTDPVKRLGQYWTTETEGWSFQDQISQPYALRLAGLRPRPFPGSHLATPWLAYQGSERHG